MAPKLVEKIQAGIHGDHVGFTQVYSDGTQSHHLFAYDIAEQLAWDLLKLCNDRKAQLPAAPRVFSDAARVSDHCAVSLSPPKED